MSSCIYFGWNYIGFIWKQKHIVVREAELFENWRNRSIRRLHVYISCNHRVTIRFCYDVCKSRVSYTIFSGHFAPNLLQRYYLRLYTIIYGYLRLSTIICDYLRLMRQVLRLASIKAHSAFYEFRNSGSRLRKYGIIVRIVSNAAAIIMPTST